MYTAEKYALQPGELVIAVPPREVGFVQQAARDVVEFYQPPQTLASYSRQARKVAADLYAAFAQREIDEGIQRPDARRAHHHARRMQRQGGFVMRLTMLEGYSNPDEDAKAARQKFWQAYNHYSLANSSESAYLSNPGLHRAL